MAMDAELRRAYARRTLAEMDAWQGLRPEPILDPGQPIIDSHHHLQQGAAPGYWPAGLSGDLACGHDVRATVYMECGVGFRPTGPDSLKAAGETAWVVAETPPPADPAQPRLCAGIVGHADLTLGEDVAPLLEAHVEAGQGRFRGVRQMSELDPEFGSLSDAPRPRGLLAAPAFREGFARLAPLGLSFDAYVFHSQLGEVADLAAAFPDTAIILDHAGSPLGVGPYAGRRGEVFATWRAGMGELARRPNVRVKLGGFGFAACGFGFQDEDLPPGSEILARAWKPYMEVCAESFGAARCMFESNFPVDRQAASYAVVWNAFKRIAADWSPSERQAALHDTAAETYRLAL